MNKKGFTLIELLAVIVILAVIALIATPVIMNAIGSAKQGAFKDAAYGILKATENVYAKGFSETAEQVDTFFLYQNGVMASYPTGKTIDYKGTTPKNGGIMLYSDGTIAMAIHDGTNCVEKSRSASSAAISTKALDSCFNSVFYYQTNAPFINLIANGNFSSGTAGWSSYYSSLNIVDGVFKSNIIRNDVTWSAAFYTYNKDYVTGQRYYIKAKARTVGPQPQLLALYNWRAGGGYSNTVHTINNPNSNQWYVLTGVSNISTTTGDTTTSTVIDRTYSNTTAASQSGIEIEYAITIDMGTSSSNPFYNLTSEQMEEIINKIWIDTTTNTPKRFTAGGWVNF